MTKCQDYFCDVIQSRLRSISPTFYEQLLQAQIRLGKNRQSRQAALCAFGICTCKSACKHIIQSHLITTCVGTNKATGTGIPLYKRPKVVSRKNFKDLTFHFLKKDNFLMFY